MSSPREIRFLEATEVRAIGGMGDADPLRIEGYASVFNSVAKLPGFRERIQPGTFKRAIEQRQDVVCLFNHDQNIVLGRTTSGTLRLNQDERGLHYVCDMPNTQTARDIHESIRRGDINGCSFAFQVAEGGQEWSEQRDEDGTYYVMRDINDVNLMDVSPVTHPCYTGTEVYARSLEMAPMELRSAVDAKNAALRSEQVTPPENIEKRPYSSVADLPSNVPSAHAKQFLEVFNSAYSAAKKDGKSDKDAESSAFAQAWGVINKHRHAAFMEEARAVVGCIDGQCDVDDCPASWSDEMKQTYCTAYNEGYKKAVEEGKKGQLAVARAISAAMCAISEMLARQDEPGSEQPNNVAEGVGVDSSLAGRADAKASEKRDDIDDDEDELDEEHDMAYIGRSYRDGDEHEDHEDFGMCEAPDCICQNRFAPSGSGYRNADFDGGEFVIFVGEERAGGMTRTKRVSGKDLSSKSFAYVGDPNKTETWKFPIHDASHVRNALARWGQAKGIPENKKAGVLAKIKAAAKKFGIQVSDDRAWPLSAEERKLFANRLNAAMRYSADQPRDDHGRFGEGSSSKEQVHDHAESKHYDAARMHTAMAHTAMSKFNTKDAQAHKDAASAHMKAGRAHGEAAKAAASGSGYKEAATKAHDASAAAYTASGRTLGL